MSNIDKDIELVSNIKNIELKGKVNEQYIYAKIPEEYLNAIENVLSEFQGLREFSTETVRRNAELQEELETYKNEIKKYKHSMAMISEICIDESKVHITTREAIEEIRKNIYHGVDIDWERKEVDKNVE